MSRPYVPAAARWLLGLGVVLSALAVAASLTDQPIGVTNLALGAAMGLVLATAVMLGEVRRSRSGT